MDQHYKNNYRIIFRFPVLMKREIENMLYFWEQINRNMNKRAKKKGGAVESVV